MKTHSTSPYSSKTGARLAAVLAGSLGLALLPLTASAQINRAHAPAGNAPVVQVQPSGPNHFSGRPMPPAYMGHHSNPGMGGFGQSGANFGMNGGYGNGGYNGVFQRNAPPGSNPGIFGNSGIAPMSGIIGGYPGPVYHGIIVVDHSRSNPPGYPNRVDPYNPVHDLTDLNSPSLQANKRNRPGDILYGGTLPGSLPPAPNRPGDVLYGGRPANVKGNAAFDRFQRSNEGFFYRYQNGNHGRSNQCFYSGWGNIYFPNGAAFYPYYYPSYINGITCPSLYSSYYGVFPPYMAMSYAYFAPPEYVYVPYPVYTPEGDYQGWRPDDLDGYYLNQDRAQTQGRTDNGYRIQEKSEDLKDKLVDTAVGDITKAWQDRDIQTLSKHVRRDSRIAVYLRGKYQYSLDASDYLDMTRDAFRATKTVRFEIDGVQRKENGVYAVTGHHVYKDRDDQERTVHVSYVLQKMDGEYYITQVGSAPDKTDEE